VIVNRKVPVSLPFCPNCPGAPLKQWFRYYLCKVCGCTFKRSDFEIVKRGPRGR